MLKKLNTNKEKRDFIERRAGISQCDHNCETECNWEYVPKVTLIYRLDLY